MASAGRAPRFGLWRVAYSVVALLACRAPGARAQDSGDTCSEITVSGLSEEDGFPPASELYTNELGADFYGKYVSEDKSSFVWYSVVDPTDHTSDMGDASITACTGGWVISSYPVGANFTDTVWYQQASSEAGCEESPSQLQPSEWIKMERDATSSSSTASVESEIQASCFLEEDDDGGSDDGGSGGLSKKTVIVLLIVIGVGFMVLMCLGALACCIKGKNSNEEGFMPPGELGEGSAIGGKAGDATKPGLHAHPEIQGAQHPRPEDWAPAYNSSSSAIPTGSRSGPSVRSIGYS